MKKSVQSLIGYALIRLFLSGQVMGQFAGGDGTEGNPYQVSTHDQLNLIRDHLENQQIYFVLINSLDLTDEFAEDGAYYNNGEGWTPIGDPDNRFMGELDGAGFSITGLFIQRPTQDYVGLFGYAKSARFKNLAMMDVDVTGNSLAGGLVGNLGSMVGPNEGLISNCTISGIVSGGSLVGGLAGQSFDPIENCWTHVEVSGTGLWIGGLTGDQRNDIENCHASGDVLGSANTWDVGGLVGILRQGEIKNASAAGNVTGQAYCGGLAGSGTGTIVNSFATGNVTGQGSYSWAFGGLVGSSNFNITASFATGNVSSHDYTGGLVGDASANTNIVNSYASGNVSGIYQYSFGTGGLVGYNKANISNSFSYGLVEGIDEVGGFIGDDASDPGAVQNSYWDTIASGQNYSAGGSGIMGRTTEQMTYPYDDTTYEGWDFVQIWQADTSGTINNGYPYLCWQVPADYSVTVIVLPENAGTVTGGGTYSPGETVTLEATPNEGYTFSSWADDEGDVSFDPEYTFTMPAGDVSLTANFDLQAFVVSVAVDPEGAGEVTGTGSYFMDEEVTLAATPNQGYEFINWTTAENEEIGEESTLVFPMPPQDIHIIANFLLINFTGIHSKPLIRLYPNPFDRYIVMENLSGIKKITITNLNGIPLISVDIGGKDQFTMDAAWFPEGIYLVRFYDDKGARFTQKIMKTQ